MNTLELFITHVEKNGDLLKICGQSDQMAAHFVERQILDNTQNFEISKLGQPKSANELTINLICCARYKDNKYYRAKIKNLAFITQSLVTVYFVDYGNTDVVLFSDIRLLDSLSVRMLASLDPLASEYYLAGVRPLTLEWDDQIINYIDSNIRYTTLQCVVVGDILGKRLIKVKFVDSDLSSHLVQRGFTVAITLKAQELMIQTQAGVNPAQFNVPPPVPVMTVRPSISSLSQRMSAPSIMPRVSAPIVQRNMMMPPNLPPPRLQHPPEMRMPPRPFIPVREQIQQFACEMLKENTEHNVFVSHVEDGPMSFAVQVKFVAQNHLVQMMTRLALITPVPKCAPLMPGVICLGRFTEDNSLCRAVVMHVVDDRCRVYYPDFGNSEMLPCSQIFELPQEFACIKLMASRFTLSGAKALNPGPEMKETFKKLVTGVDLIMRVAPMEDNRTKQYCELFLEGRSVKDLLVEADALEKAAPLNYVQIAPPARGLPTRVLVSYVESTRKILVQLASNKDTLETLMSCVAQHCRDKSLSSYTVDQLRVGLPVCTYYQPDNLWYRAQVVDIMGENVMVLFVDYGNEDMVPVTALRYISPELAKQVRAQALKCCLAGFETGEPNEDLDNKLHDLISNYEVVMKVLGVLANNVLLVEFYDENETNISSFLLPRAPAPVSRSVAPQPLAPVSRTPVAEDEWHSDVSDDKEKKFMLPLRSRDGRAGSGSYDDRNEQNRSNSESGYKKWEKHSDDQKGGGKWNKSNDGGGFRTEEGSGGWRSKGDSEDRDSNSFRKPSDRWKSKDESDSRTDGGFRNKDNDNWRSRDSDNRDGGGFRSKDNNDSWRSRDSDNKDSFRSKDNDNWKSRDSDSNRDGGGWRSRDSDNRDGGGFRNKDNNDSWRSRDSDNKDSFRDKDNWKSRDSDSRGDGGGWKSRDDEGSRGGQKYNRDDKFGGGRGGGYSNNRDNNRFDSGGGSFGGDRGRSFNDDSDKTDGPKRFDKPRGGSRFGNDVKPSGEFGSGGGGYSSGRGGFGGGGGGYGGSGGRGGSRDGFSSRKDNWGSSFAKDSFASASPKKLTVPNVSVKLGDREIIEVVYSISPVEFFIQATKQKDELTELMAKVADGYTSDGTLMTSPDKGDYCVAQYAEDEVWYRGLIQSKDGSTASVLFIDFGNTEEVSVEKIKVITSDLCTLPAQAIKCALLGAGPRNETGWSDEEMTEFALATETKTLEAHFLSKIFVSDTFQICLRDITISAEEAVVVNNLFGATDEVLQSIVPPPKDAVVKFNPYPVVAGSALEIQITWFMSPDRFYVQPLLTNSEFREMMEHIQDHVKSLKLISDFDQEVGAAVIARFKEDKVLYRAQILEAQPGSSNKLIYFIDYGNTEEIDKSHVWTVEAEYSMMPCQAIECILAGVKPAGEGEAWPAPKTTKLETYFEADKYTCSFISVMEDGKFLVSLEQDGAGVADQLIANGLAAEDATTVVQLIDECRFPSIRLSLLVGQIVRVLVMAVEDKSRMFVQLQPTQAQLINEEVAALIAELPPTVLSKESAIEGAVCLVKMEELGWQRASILEFDEDGVGPTVHLIDYGSSVRVAADQVYELPDSQVNIPGQAFECVFKVKEDVDDDKLKEELVKKEVLLLVKDVQLPNRLDAVLYTSEGTIYSEPLDDVEEKKPAITVDAICPMPIFQKRQSMSLSHAEKDEIYLQKPSDLELLTDLLTRIFDFYEDFGTTCGVAWEPGMLCAAQSLADEQWYRAMVLHTEEDSINVRFIDYGNTELLTTDKIKTLAPLFTKENAYAVKVKLPVEWTVSEENLMELIPEEEFDTEFVLFQNEWYVEMVDKTGKRLTDRLIELGFATETEHSPFIKIESSFSKLHVGEKFSVCKMHVESPSQFWVVLNEDFEKLENLQDKLQSCATSMRPITKNSVQAQNHMVVTKFSDGIWYRARYHSTTDVVFSVDYGNTELCSSHLRELPEEFLQPDGYAIECALNVQPVSGAPAWDDDVITLFDNMIVDEEIIAHILKITETAVVVDLMFKEESISNSLVTKGIATVCNSSAYVSHVNSPSDFYVQEESELLNQIKEHLTQADSFTVIEDITNHTESIFAAEYTEDGLWYRAKYLEKTDDGLNVLFVDYGNTDVIQQFRELPKELLAMPLMAKHCSLQLPDSITEWSTDACEHFIELVADGCTLFEVKILNDCEPKAVDLLTDGLSVTDQLLAVGTQEGQEETNDVVVGATKVFISRINSPADFWVQFEDAPIDDMTGQLASALDWEVLTDVEDNMLVAALYEDEQWYRAQVLNKTDECINVLFIDYGNFGPAIEIRKLPEELADAAAIAKHCRLELPAGVSEWSPEATGQFLEMTKNVAVEVNFLKAEDEPAVVALSINNEDLATTLSTFCDSKTDVDDDSSPKVVVVHINSLSDFYVHVDHEKVEEMTSNMLEANSFENCVPDLLLESIVAACFPEDEQWYRAKIIAKSEDDGFEVLFVDYGNSSVVTDIRVLPKEIADIPPLARWCRFEASDKWTDEASEHFRKLAVEGEQEFGLKFVCEDASPCIVELMLEGKPVSKLLQTEDPSNLELGDTENVKEDETTLTEIAEKTDELELNDKSSSVINVKTPLSEKIVPGAVGLGISLDVDTDNIQESASSEVGLSDKEACVDTNIEEQESTNIEETQEDEQGTSSEEGKVGSEQKNDVDELSNVTVSSENDIVGKDNNTEVNDTSACDNAGRKTPISEKIVPGAVGLGISLDVNADTIQESASSEVQLLDKEACVDPNIEKWESTNIEQTEEGDQGTSSEEGRVVSEQKNEDVDELSNVDSVSNVTVSSKDDIVGEETAKKLSGDTTVPILGKDDETEVNELSDVDSDSNVTVNSVDDTVYEEIAKKLSGDITVPILGKDDETELNNTSTCDIAGRKTPISEKIVPGCVSLGMSLDVKEDISTETDDEEIDDALNYSDELHNVHITSSDVVVNSMATGRVDEMVERHSSEGDEMSVNATGASNNENHKTPFSEKIVPGAVSLGLSLDFKIVEDELSDASDKCVTSNESVCNKDLSEKIVPKDVNIGISLNEKKVEGEFSNVKFYSISSNGVEDDTSACGDTIAKTLSSKKIIPGDIGLDEKKDELSNVKSLSKSSTEVETSACGDMDLKTPVSKIVPGAVDLGISLQVEVNDINAETE